ncbi:Nitrogen regulation protein NtrY [hydrothermal vent metagenome]|uniref:histidine kinase n=1 Tax=hydrothermal vent metagenome TaxID=652676 RepID=A0A3B0TI09_9ZZZZ
MDALAKNFDSTPSRRHDAVAGEGPPSDTPPLARGPFYFGLFLVFASLILGITTYLILTGETRLTPTDLLVKGLLSANVILVLALVAAIGWQIIAVVRARARGTAGARLHVRLVAMFGLIAVVPAILVAIFASVTLDRGLDAWFSARTRAIIDGAQKVAESYLREHGQVIRSDIIAMGTDINRAIGLYRTDRDAFLKLLTQQARIRSLSAAFVIRDDGEVGAQAIANSAIRYSAPPAAAFDQANDGRVIIFAPGPDYMVRALIKLKDFERGMLYVYRQVDQTVVDHLLRTRERRAEYDALALSRTGVQATFAFLYVGMALIFLLAAVWFGLWVANWLVAPIGRLINAARRVSEGDLSVTVDINQSEGDVASLARTFNTMIAELNSQRKALLTANTTLEERRRFMEAVLSGVTAGVVGLDRRGRVELINSSALELLGLSHDSVIGKPLGEVVPEFSTLIETARSRPGRPADKQVSLVIGGSERTVHARITSEPAKGAPETEEVATSETTKTPEKIEKPGDFVVTFDDITELQTAQRSSAWADIARRIAHEIKNPLTPIQLSAERLKRKYGKHIQTDREVFEQCINTIVRQVGDIGRMVDEFSSFARMPKAKFEAGNLSQVVRDAVILQKMSLQNIDFEVQLPDEPVEFAFDRRLVSQALTNLIKNASEAIEAVEMGQGERGRIVVAVKRLGPDRVAISVTDNGCGLPKKDRNRLTEPYMTTRENGTGLGLAIVRRIIEEHGGTITLKDAAAAGEGARGAVLRLEFPLREPIASDNPPARPQATRAKAPPSTHTTGLRGDPQKPESESQVSRK